MLNLTNDERRSLLFLSLVILVGLAISFLGKKYPVLRNSLSSSYKIFQLDLNKIDKKTLLDIPGIGEKLSCRILEYRKENGQFFNKEDLKNIKGINSYKYEKIKNYFR